MQRRPPSLSSSNSGLVSQHKRGTTLRVPHRHPRLFPTVNHPHCSTRDGAPCRCSRILCDGVFVTALKPLTDLFAISAGGNWTNGPVNSRGLKVHQLARPGRSIGRDLPMADKEHRGDASSRRPGRGPAGTRPGGGRKGGGKPFISRSSINLKAKPRLAKASRRVGATGSVKRRLLRERPQRPQAFWMPRFRKPSVKPTSRARCLDRVTAPFQACFLPTSSSGTYPVQRQNVWLALKIRPSGRRERYPHGAFS
jgi:hypothetical protein